MTARPPRIQRNLGQRDKPCADQARKESINGPQLDELVGTTAGWMRLTLDQIVRTIVGKMYSKKERFEFDDDGFQQEWDLISHFLNAETFDHVTIAPLPGFTATLPAKISEYIEIDQLTDEEVTRCVRVGILGPITPDFELIHGESAVGIRCTTSTEKVVGRADLVSETGSFGRRVRVDTITLVDDVLTALHLFKQGNVPCPGEVSGVKAWLLGAGHSFRIRASRHFSFCNYELQDREVEALQEMWSDLTAGTVNERAFLAIALRRFNMAFGRQQLGDQIVDLMIAAEALFLSDAEAGRGELRFRLAVRAAMFVEAPQYTRRQVFDLMRKAYNVRSGVVHGGSIKNTGLPGKLAATFGEFVSAFEYVMRLGLQKALVHPQVGQTGYWEDLLFSDPVESGPD